MDTNDQKYEQLMERLRAHDIAFLSGYRKVCLEGKELTTYTMVFDKGVDLLLDKEGMFFCRSGLRSESGRIVMISEPSVDAAVDCLLKLGV